MEAQKSIHTFHICMDYAPIRCQNPMDKPLSGQRADNSLEDVTRRKLAYRGPTFACFDR